MEVPAEVAGASFPVVEVKTLRAFVDEKVQVNLGEPGILQSVQDSSPVTASPRFIVITSQPKN